MKISGNLNAPSQTKKIVIASPAYRGEVCIEFVRTLVQLLSKSSNALFSSFMDADLSDIALARNLLISRFYFHKKDCSHILFMDNDMGFPPELIYQMIDLNEDVVSAICPKREMNLEVLHQSGDLSFAEAYNKALHFIGEPTIPHPDNPAFRHIDAIGAGIMLISRDCIRKMIKNCPDIVDNNKFKNSEFLKTKFDQFLTPFAPISLKNKNLSEDISFCHRWTQKCKGEIYAGTGFEIEHVMKHTIKGKYQPT